MSKITRREIVLRLAAASLVAPLILDGHVAAAQGDVPDSGSGLTILETASFYSEFAQGLYVVGMIENQSDSALGVKTIAVSLVGSAGEKVAGTQSRSKPSMLEPGQKSGWGSLVSRPPEFSDVRVHVESSPPRSEMEPETVHDVQIEGVVSHPRGPAAYPMITGQVVNTGTKTLERTLVLGAVFTDGKLVDTAQVDAGLMPLAPGKSAPFSMTFTAEVLQDPSSFHLYAEGRVKRP